MSEKTNEENSIISDNNSDQSSDKSSNSENESDKSRNLSLNKTSLLAELNRSLRLLGSDDNTIIEDIYFRNDPIYEEINGYIVGEVLGSGSFAEVKEFVDKRSLKRFAAKIVDKRGAKRKGESYLKNIELEMSLLRQLNHKNVVKAYDFFEIDSYYYLIIEYCSGVLSEYLESNDDSETETPQTLKLPKSQSHYYFRQLVDGLEYLHSLGVIHHDIKPNNLLIDNSHTLKITDFGTSTVIDNFQESNLIEVIYKGSPAYMAPEIVADNSPDGSNPRLNGSAYDVWSSGVTLFQMISGRLPYPQIMGHIIANTFDTNDIEYPIEISEDKQLLYLFQNIFVEDYNKRISIYEIKSHPWLLLEFPDDDFVDLGPKPSGDIYDTITILPNVQTLYYSPHLKADDDQVVTKEEFEESNLRTRLMRGNRKTPEKSTIKRRAKRFQRLKAFGF